MYWSILVLAGLFEIAWAVGLKYTEGFTRLVPSLLTGTAMVISIVLLAIATKKLPLGTAYAVWTGIGAVGAVTMGIMLFGESAQPLRLLVRRVDRGGNPGAEADFGRLNRWIGESKGRGVPESAGPLNRRPCRRWG